MKAALLTAALCVLALVAFAPAADARLIPCQDQSINFKPACSYFYNGDYKGDCVGYFSHHPVSNDEWWVACNWE